MGDSRSNISRPLSEEVRQQRIAILPWIEKLNKKISEEKLGRATLFTLESKSDSEIIQFAFTENSTSDEDKTDKSLNKDIKNTALVYAHLLLIKFNHNQIQYNKMIQIIEQLFKKLEGLSHSGTGNIFKAKLKEFKPDLVKNPILSSSAKLLKEITDDLSQYKTSNELPRNLESVTRVANDLFRINNQLLSHITQAELTGTHKQKLNINAMTNQFITLNNKVIEDILTSNGAPERTLAMESWIRVMDLCFQKGDYFSVAAITGALTSTLIERLTLTEGNLVSQGLKAGLTGYARERLEFYTQYIINNYQKLEQMRPSTIPVIQFIMDKLEHSKEYVSLSSQQNPQESQATLNRNTAVESVLQKIQLAQMISATDNKTNSTARLLDDSLFKHNILNKNTIENEFWKKLFAIQPKEKEKRKYETVDLSGRFKKIIADLNTIGVTPTKEFQSKQTPELTTSQSAPSIFITASTVKNESSHSISFFNESSSGRSRSPSPPPTPKKPNYIPDVDDDFPADIRHIMTETNKALKQLYHSANSANIVSTMRNLESTIHENRDDILDDYILFAKAISQTSTDIILKEPFKDIRKDLSNQIQGILYSFGRETNMNDIQMYGANPKTHERQFGNLDFYISQLEENREMANATLLHASMRRGQS